MIYDDIFQIITKFRDYCFSLYKNDIDPVTPDERKDRFRGILPTNYERSITLTSICTNNPSIINLIYSPRQLKNVLRKVFQTWNILHGEIDFDDLLVANVLRQCAPEAYDFLMENIKFLRNIREKNYMSPKKTRLGIIKERWEKLRDIASWDFQAAEEMITFFFPDFAEHRFAYGNFFQSIARDTPTDYWQRLNDEYLLNVEILDQEVLRALRLWKKDPDLVCFRGMQFHIAMYDNEHFSEKIFQFGRAFLDQYDIRNLAEKIFNIAVVDFNAASSRNNILSLNALHSLLLSLHNVDKNQHYKWLGRVVSSILPKSLKFANDILYMWRDYQDGMTGDSYDNHEMDNYYNILKSTFSNNPRLLTNSIDNKYIWSLFQAVKLATPNDKFKFEKWKWLGRTSLRAFKIAPEVIGPQIVPLIFSSDRGHNEYINTFDAEFANSIFNDDLSLVMEYIADLPDYPDIESQGKSIIAFAKTEAKNWKKNK